MKFRLNSQIVGNRGYSMAELMVILSIIAILASVTVFYNRSIEREIIIFKEQAKILSAIQKAKSLSFNIFGKDKAPCGYGVHFSLPDSKMVIFQENSPSDDSYCQDIDAKYTSDSEKFEEINLDKTVKFSELGASNIVFIPPDAMVIIDADFSKTEALIKIKTIDNKSKKTIKVTNTGQITTQ